MRINVFVAQATGLSRRAADRAIQEGRVAINGNMARLGDTVNAVDAVTLDGTPIVPAKKTIIMLNKPAGYVCSRRGQGSRTIYDLLPPEYHSLKPVGRLDKASSGLLLLTNDGPLANTLTHPRYAKTKLYDVTLNKALTAPHKQQITGKDVHLEDGPSGFGLEPAGSAGRKWRVALQEGRNRQIRRTFTALGYEVRSLHRTQFGPYSLHGLKTGEYRLLEPPSQHA